MADWSTLDALGQRTMTHQAEQPNPVPGIVEAARKYLQSGDYNPAHEPGTNPQDYLRELLRNPDIMAKNIGQAMNFASLGSIGGKVRSAAIRTPQGIFEGPNHASIIDALARKYGDGIYKDIEDGFVTTNGKFLDRPEANKLALEQNQHLKPNVIPELFGSEDLRRVEE